jgi:NitT/TauT family transport system ATP-binding protein
MSSKVVVMSRRPGRIIDTFDIGFPFPRQPDLRYEPEFSKLCGAVSRALRHAIEA